MKILFIHQNYPGQFKFLAPALSDAGHTVRTLTMRDVPTKNWEGVRVEKYSVARSTSKDVHPWGSDFETKVIRGDACYNAALRLKKKGLEPDVIIAHPGWGESLFLKEVWPSAKLGLYCEFFYHSRGLDVGFDPEFTFQQEDHPCRINLKNVNNLVHMPQTDAGISPTKFQADTYPEPFRSKITVVHDGIDTGQLVPDPKVDITINKVIKLTRADEVVTFASRNLEPCRGFHIFMRALPELLAQRPKARVLIVGSTTEGYGPLPPQGGTWKDVLVEEVRPKVKNSDWERVHFLGLLPYNYFLNLLQISTIHVYLTYPFVLSWSLLEAMSVGCTIVASSTPPLLEAITHNENGRLVDFFNSSELTEQICELLQNESERERLGRNAREFAKLNYDLNSVCLPKQIAWVNGLAET